MNTDPLLLNVKRFILIVVAWLVAVILHNAVYAIWGVEDAVFFILAVIVIPLYFLVSLVYTLISRKKKA